MRIRRTYLTALAIAPAAAAAILPPSSRVRRMSNSALLPSTTHPSIAT